MYFHSVKINLYQWCKLELFRAGKISWNEKTLINISPTTSARKTQQWKMLKFFLLDTCKILF